jgi:hypothetical protein
MAPQLTWGLEKVRTSEPQTLSPDPNTTSFYGTVAKARRAKYHAQAPESTKALPMSWEGRCASRGRRA